MPDYSYVIFDSANFGASANAESILFQTVQGGDATHNEPYTNARGSGQFPPGEKFLVKRVGLMVDKVTNKADVQNMFVTSVFQLDVANVTVLKIPGQLAVARSAYSGSALEATIVDTMTVGLMGDGYMLDLPITINGGIPFRVRLLSGQAVTASSLVKAFLDGVLTMAGSI